VIWLTQYVEIRIVTEIKFLYLVDITQAIEKFGFCIFTQLTLDTYLTRVFESAEQLGKLWYSYTYKRRF